MTPIRLIPGSLRVLCSLAAVLLISHSRADFQSTVLSQSPVGYWPLNEVAVVPEVFATNTGTLGAVGNGTFENDILAGLPGALPAQVSSNLAIRGEGYLNGNRVRVPYHPVFNTNSDFSVEFWCKPGQTNFLACPAASTEFADPSTNQALRRGWLFYQGQIFADNTDNGSGWIFRTYNIQSGAGAQRTQCAVTDTLDTNKWYHIVGTYKSTPANSRQLTLYVNGVSVATASPPNGPSGGYENVTTNTIPLTFGARADGDFGFWTYIGSVDEGAFYPYLLTPAQVLNHYQVGTNNAPGTNYQNVILGHSPAGYWRLNERLGPIATNLGSSAANAEYLFSSTPGVPGPRPPTLTGFAAGNTAVDISANTNFGGVRTAPLQLNTNTVTIAAWIKPNGSQSPYAGIFMNAATDGTYSGLNIGMDGGFQIGYTWNNDAATYDFPSTVTVPDGQWSFVAVSVGPTQAVIYAHDGTTFQSSANGLPHPVQGFNGLSRIGLDYIYAPDTVFNGTIDEVSVFNQTMSAGEVFSLYAAGKGGVAPVILADVVAPGSLAAGETLTLNVDSGGTPTLGYQWRKNGGNLGGATGTSYSKANVTSADDGNYDVVVTNAFGAVTSSVAAITVSGQVFPSISEHPADATVYQGGYVKLTVTASGGGLNYIWRKSGGDISGATSSALIFSPADGTNAGSYDVVVSNNVGSVTSSAATVAVIVPAAGTYAAAVVADLPTSWWRLDESPGSPTFADAMGRNPGTWVNSPNLGVAGVSGGNSAAYFPAGGTAYGQVPYSPDLNTQPITVECWVHTTNFTGAQTPVASWAATPSDRGYLFYLSDIEWRTLIAFTDGLFYVPNGAFKSARWTHLVFTLSPAEGWTTYLNGVLAAGPYSAAGVLLNTSYPFHIGTDVPGASGFDNYFDGTIDEVAVYPTVLSAQRIFDHYQAALYGGNSLPVFLTQPQSQTVAEGGSVTFTSEVEGTPPITRQWLKNGAPIPDATNASLTLTGVTFADATNYRLSATNSAGTSNSQPAILTVVAQPTYASLTNQLVLHLKFDGDYLDSSGRGNHGYPSNSPSLVTGRIGAGALSYATVQIVDTNSSTTNYEASFVNLDIRPDLQFGTSTDFSVAFWIKFTGTPGDLPVLANSSTALSDQGYTFGPGYQTGGIGWSLNSYRFESGPQVNDDAWHHVVVSISRTGQAATYVDGTLVDSRFGTATELDTPFPTVIGQTGTFFYEEAGAFLVDDLGVWRRALTPIEAYSIWYVGQNYSRSFDQFGPVLLVLRHNGTNLELVWQSGTLKQADNLTGPWSNVPGASAPYHTISPTAEKKFYRVEL